MGNCAGKDDISNEPTFKVTNINDNHVLVRKGLIIVTETELVYVDSKSKQEWQWPFKYLRRYGCEGNVFSFEAGRKCANGEGTYAFVCNKANDLFTIVAKNIAHGNVQPDVDNSIINGTVNPLHRSLEDTLPPPPPPPLSLPLLPDSVPPPSTDSAPIPSASVPTPTTDSAPTPAADSAPIPSVSAPTPDSAPIPKNYTNLVFTNEATETIHSQSANDDHTPYSKIAFDKTEELSRQSKKKVSLSDIKLEGGSGRRHTEGGSSSSGRRRKKRSSSLSNSSIDTPNALHSSITESIPERDLINESSYQNLLIQDTKQLLEIDQPNYTNIDISTGEIISPQQQQLPDYSNVNIEEQPSYENLLLPTGPVVSSTPIATPTQKRQHDYFNYTPGSDMTTPTAEQPNYSNVTTDRVGGASLIEDSPNYLNLNIGNGGGGDLPQRSHTFNHSESRTHSNSRSTTLPAGGTRGTYAVLNLPSSQYAQLDIKGVESDTPTPISTSTRDRSTSSISRLTDIDPHTDYTVLNFQAMDVLHSMREERDKDILEKEKEKELAAKQQQDKLQNKKTGRGHKK